MFPHKPFFFFFSIPLPFLPFNIVNCTLLKKKMRSTLDFNCMWFIVPRWMKRSPPLVGRVPRSCFCHILESFDARSSQNVFACPFQSCSLPGTYAHVFFKWQLDFNTLFPAALPLSVQGWQSVYKPINQSADHEISSSGWQMIHQPIKSLTGID